MKNKINNHYNKFSNRVGVEEKILRKIENIAGQRAHRTKEYFQENSIKV